jgi:hypothetical protein
MTLKQAFNEQCMLVFALMITSFAYEVIASKLGLPCYQWLPAHLLLVFYGGCLTLGTLGRYYFNNSN